MAARYARAAMRLPAKSGAALAGAGIVGHWLDDRHYFYVRGRFEPALGTIIDEPWIADASAGACDRVLDLEKLAPLLPDGAGWQQRARYAMTRPDELVVTLDGVEHLVDPSAPALVGRRILPGEVERRSPDGRYAVSVKGQDLWLRDIATGDVRALTSDGVPRCVYGQRPECGISALSDRRRPEPVGLWSSDSSWFLTHRIDERHLAERVLVEHAPADGGPPRAHPYACVVPGDPLPSVDLVAINVETGVRIAAPPFQLHLFSPIAMNLAWFCGVDRFCSVAIDRFSRTIELHEVSLRDGTTRPVMRETADHGYLDLHPLLGSPPNVRLLPATEELIWYSERDGHGHLYLYAARTGTLLNQITHGDWHVRDIVHVDPARRLILFTAGGIDPERDPGFRTLCRIGFDGQGFEMLVDDPGDVAVRPGPLDPAAPAVDFAGASPSGRHVVLRRTDLLTGARTVLRDIDRGTELILARNEAVAVPAPRRFVARAADGVTALHGVLFLPGDFDPESRYPLLDLIYPGPQSAFLPRGHGSRAAALAQSLAELGMVVLIVDSRGVPFRRRDLRQAGYGEQLEPQLADHAAVVGQLCARHPFLDPHRIGIIGSSGGGAAAARAMFDYGEVFTAGVAICGNHDSRHYLAGWMEKYVGPAWRAKGEAQAAATHAAKLRGPLFLITGEMDENVHPAHTLALADALIKAGKSPELLVVPNEGHLVLATSALAQLRIWDFLTRHLLNRLPPGGFSLTYDDADRRSLASIGLWEALG